MRREVWATPTGNGGYETTLYGGDGGPVTVRSRSLDTVRNRAERWIGRGRITKETTDAAGNVTICPVRY